MTKEYILRNLECPNCANKIEVALNKVNGVTFANVNFTTTTLKIEYDESIKDIEMIINKTVHLYESEVKVIEKSNMVLNSKVDKDSKKTLIILVIGTILFSLGIFLKAKYGFNNNFILAIFLSSYAILGGEVILKAVKNIFKVQFFDENFLMAIATIGAFIIGDFTESVAVMLFYRVGEFFQSLAVAKSKKSIADLMDIRPDYANLVIGKDTKKVGPDDVKIGDYIIVKPGEKIPLDGIVVEGESMVDTSALTGESIPRHTKIDDAVISGCINQTGVLKCKVTKEYYESTVVKIIELVENASSKKSPTENFITKFSRYYTPIVVLSATLLAVAPPLLFNGIWSEWIHRGLIFLVISCPCALVISIPLSFFGGIGNASRKGILIKGSNYLEALSNLDIVVFDKTGTLTKGTFEVAKIIPSLNYAEKDVLEYASRAEVFSNHPIAFSIINYYGKPIDKEEIKNYNEISGHGVSATFNKKNILAGNEKLMKKYNIKFDAQTVIGTKIYVALDKEYIGCIVITDQIKKDSYKAISELRKNGVRKIVMLTGDNKSTAEIIFNELKLDNFYSELLPNQKVEILEKLDCEKRVKGKLAFVGDGINDAPVLARSDIGIAMGGLGSDAAIEASDIVLMTDEPSKLVDAINVAKATKKIVWQNISFALGIKLIFLGLGAFGIANMWEAVFADVGVSVIAVFNAMRILRMK
ncbi:MAG: heavy metal translocating P-type ATPase [Bacilli bacterium]|nr:heavy metal translocating P-type ATPase [Bacilli bacterium]